MKRPMALALVTALLLAGVGAGALATHLFYAKQMDRPAEGPLWFMRPPSLRQLDDRLQLSSDQRSRIEEILRDSRRDGEKIRRQTRPQIEELLKDTHERLLQVLTPDQRSTFEDMAQRHHHHHRRDGHRLRKRRPEGPGTEDEGRLPPAEEHP